VVTRVKYLINIIYYLLFVIRRSPRGKHDASLPDTVLSYYIRISYSDRADSPRGGY